MSTARLDDDFWTDPRIEQLNSDEKLIFIWLFTNPYRNWIGIYKLPKPMIKEQTGLTDTVIDRGIDRLINTGLISYNSEFKMVFVKSMLKRQMSQTEGQEKLSKTQIQGIINQLKTLHNCPLIQEFLEKYSYLNIPYGYTPTDTPMDTPNYINPQPQPQPQPNITTPRKRGGAKTFLPDDFEISDRNRELLKADGFTEIDIYLPYFKDWAKSNNKQYADWDATFRNCVRGDWGNIRKNNNAKTRTTKNDAIDAYMDNLKARIVNGN